MTIYEYPYPWEPSIMVIDGEPGHFHGNQTKYQNLVLIVIFGENFCGYFFSKNDEMAYVNNILLNKKPNEIEIVF